MSKMLKEARPIAEAAVISIAIVIASLAVPAAILYAAAWTRKLKGGCMRGLTSQCRDSWTLTLVTLLEYVRLRAACQSENQRMLSASPFSGLKIWTAIPATWATAVH